MTDEEWWAVNGPLLARVFDETRFPTAARVGAAAGAAHRGAYSPGHAYEFGLRCVLDGLGALIESGRRLRYDLGELQNVTDARLPGVVTTMDASDRAPGLDSIMRTRHIVP